MAFEILMGIHVTDDNEFQKYRDGMEPILNSVGGSVGYDFRISEVLLSKTDDEINRVFTMEFPSEKVMNDFLSRPEYLKVKSTYLDRSVKTRTTIAMYEKSS